MSENPTSNERTFQGKLWYLINSILDSSDQYNFKEILQEQNIGVDDSRFADGLLYSSKDTSKKILFELKDSSWDATDEKLVYDAMMKAFNRGYEYFVTGTPRQLVIYQTFRADTTLHDRKLKIYDISTIRKNTEVTTTFFEKQAVPQLKIFLKDLDDLVHGTRAIQWDTIDRFFVKKLSAYILEGSAEMADVMYEVINSENDFKKRLKEYLRNQDIFNITLKFDGEEVYKICQLANYLLYLKIIFYSYLQREVTELNLKPLEIPEEKDQLNKTLRDRFNDVLKHDFELIFRKNILDEFQYDDEYIPVLKKNVEQIRSLNFTDLNVDIIGSIYNTLIDNQEQHDRGQHFTNVNEVDIVNAFCINKNTELILDSGCGAGTFLVRAYQFLKNYHKKLTHEQLLERLWGIEIAPFPAFLATMNLSLLDIKTIDNYPVIIREDFSEIKSTSSQKLIFPSLSQLFHVKDIDGKIKQVNIPAFDACVGNPPYIRQELIDNKQRWIDLAKSEQGLKKVNQQSDLYVYYLMHTASFLKDGGRLGYVISSSWLDVSFGTGFQKYLLDNFKIIAIIDNQKIRSFETASINTVILILEKCSDREEREKNKVKFVRVFKEYDELIGNSSDKDRFKNLEKFVYRIEKTNKLSKDNDLLITVRTQKELEEESTFEGEYTNGNWGAKYLRSPEIYTKIIETAGDKLIPLNSIATVRRGFTTGANEFFYVIDETEKAKKLSDEEFLAYFGHKKSTSKINWEANGWYYSEMSKKHYLLERRYFKPLFKTQKEAVNLDVDIDNLKYSVLICNETKPALRKHRVKLLKYIEEAEATPYKFNERPTCAARIKPDGTQDWFNLGEDLFVGDFIFPSKIHEKYGLIDNTRSNVYTDKVNYNIKIIEGYERYNLEIFLIMNSTLFRYFLELFARQMGEGLTDIDVNVVQKTLLIHPKLLKEHKTELKKLYKSFKNRRQEVIYEEIKSRDRYELDKIIFKTLGLSENDLSEFYKEVVDLRKRRNEKAASVNKTKTKQKIDYDSSLKLAKDRFDEIKTYKELIEKLDCAEFSIPNLEPIFPKDIGSGDSNFFANYNVKFKEGNKQITVNFENNGQILLYQFFYKHFKLNNTKIKLPESSSDCEKVLKALEKDFKKYSSQIKAMLKTHRSNAHYLSIYKDIILG
jgi:methylase of polypeptide subunit release factors